jgi:hypothetical protein
MDTTHLVMKVVFGFLAKLALCSHPHVSVSKREAAYARLSAFPAALTNTFLMLQTKPLIQCLTQ